MINEISQAAYIMLLLIFIPVPYATDRRSGLTPWVTYGITAVNATLFLVAVLPSLGSIHANDVFDKWGLVPRTAGILNLVTYMFLHVSLAHLLWNSAFLWLFGPRGEDAFGHIPYLALYLSGGVVAGLLHVAIVLLFAENSAVAYAPMVGASGAISAVIGLYFLRFYRSKLKLIWGGAYFLQLPVGKFELPAIVGIGVWLFQNLCGAIMAIFMPDRNGIAYWAHIGGFIFGMTVAEFSGVFVEGLREYLFADAVSAGERGEEGVSEAVSKFRVLLQRKPDDIEVQEELALLAQEAQESDNPSGKLIVAEAYGMLIEHAWVSGDKSGLIEWKAAYESLDANDILSATAMLRLASAAVRSGEPDFADNVYVHVAKRFPGTEVADLAVLEAAHLRLEQLDTQSTAISLLNNHLNSGRNHHAQIVGTGSKTWMGKLTRTFIRRHS